jgi:hypothetical protein
MSLRLTERSAALLVGKVVPTRILTPEPAVAPSGRTAAAGYQRYGEQKDGETTHTPTVRARDLNV